MSDEDAAMRAERASARLAGYPGEIISAGVPKPLLYQHLDPLGRFVQMAELCRAQWLATGRQLQTCPRELLPGEVFRIDP